MEHGDHICKIGLVVANEKYIFIRQIPNNFRTLYFQFIEPFIACMRHQTQKTNQEFFDKKYMTERVFLKYAHRVLKYKIHGTKYEIRSTNF